MRQPVPFARLLGFAALLLLLLAVAGCQSSPLPDASPTTAKPPATAATTTLPQSTPTSTPASAPSEPTVSAEDGPVAPTASPEPAAPGSQQVVAAARTDLAQRLGVSENESSVSLVEAVEWPDGSLGCPQPGMSYVQVLTPGFRLILQVEGTAYEYHTDTRQTVVLCEEISMSDLPAIPEPVEPVPGPVEPGLEGLVAQAKSDLADTLSIPVDQIEVLEARAVVWPDGGLGCPDPDMAYTQVPQDGVLIRLTVGSNVYNYHGGGGSGLFLCQQKFKSIEPLP